MVDPMVKVPVEDVVTPIPAESFTVTATPESGLPEEFLTVPEALQPQDWPTTRAVKAAPSRIDLLLWFEFRMGSISRRTRFGDEGELRAESTTRPRFPLRIEDIRDLSGSTGDLPQLLLVKL